MPQPLNIAKAGNTELTLLPGLANRHGLIAGGGQETATASSGRTATGGIMDALGGILGGTTGPRGGHREGALESAAKSAARAIGSQVGREIVRGVLGSIFGGTKRR